ncbi:MAG: PEP-CTERM sorting domain-containing protein [Isosphaeraceae bacterium]|nr:PEP-CTERM sorting domain-containing protein [Isosphaeraceae bacterium]
MSVRSWMLAAGVLIGSATQAGATLVGVSWAADFVPDGVASGTLGGLGVSLISTNGSVNGGFTFPANWPNQAGTNDVPGIGALAGANRNAIDWNAGTVGFATVAFSGGSVVNPILLFDFTDPGETFDFADGLVLQILDQSPVGSVGIHAGNVVTINSSPSNGAHDGFALQLMGSFSTFTFATNLNRLSAQSVGFSIAAELNAVPEPSSLATATLGLIGLVAFVRPRLRVA